MINPNNNISIECANCGEKEGIKHIHIETDKADLYLPYCPNCHGDEKEYTKLIKEKIAISKFF